MHATTTCVRETEALHPALATLKESHQGQGGRAATSTASCVASTLHIDKFKRLRSTRRAALASATWSSAGTRTTSVTTTPTVTGWQHGFPDALARLDLDTARRVPWDGNVPFFLGEFVNADGSTLPGVPAADAQARARARCTSWACCPWPGWSSSGSTLQRNAAVVGCQSAAWAPKADHTRHVWLFAAAHGLINAGFLQCTDGRDARLWRAHRRLAHRDRARACTKWRSPFQ
jgi:hypothetical protein